MDNVYTLFKLDCRNTDRDFFYLLHRMKNSDVFESNDLIDYLDQHKVNTKLELCQGILRFCQSTKNVNLKIPDLAEVTLN